MLFDTAFHGGYARRMQLTYAFATGETLTVESIRPTAAVSAGSIAPVPPPLHRDLPRARERRFAAVFRIAGKSLLRL